MDALKEQAQAIAQELIQAAHLTPGQTVVIGCSTSEVSGQKIGSSSSPELGQTLFNAFYEIFHREGIYVAAQCCEHLNRALITSRFARPFEKVVNVVPFPKAGGSFATAAYHTLTDPIAIEEIQADAGLDIGNTLIGMHLKPVAVPLRLTHHQLGQAWVNAAKTRPKFIGGERAHYDPHLK